MNIIDTKQLYHHWKESLDNTNCLILDVRGQDEFARGHIKGAVNIPHCDLSEISDKQLENLKNYKTLYIHCKSGGRAQVAGQILEQLGCKNIACLAKGGMDEWSALGYELHS